LDLRNRCRHQIFTRGRWRPGVDRLLR
jgi:hypothetical protein